LAILLVLLKHTLATNFSIDVQENGHGPRLWLDF
jgi:hypothetical protein